jgi:carboxyl-terminal processing protease
MRVFNSHDYSKLFQAFTLLFLGLFLGCAGNGKGTQERIFLDRDFASYCEAFEATAKFAIDNHFRRTAADYPALRKATAADLAGRLGVEQPTAEASGCADLAAIGTALEGKENAPTELDLYRTALNVFAGEMDPHSTYLTPKQLEQLKATDANQFYGIGVQFRSRYLDRWVPLEAMTVEEVFPGSAADGYLREGDRIVDIDGNPVKGRLLEDSMRLLRKPEGVTLRVDGNDRPIPLTPSKYSWSPILTRIEERDGFRTGYVQVRQFTEGVAELAGRRIGDLLNDGVGGLVVDLRNNPGGVVKEAVMMAAGLTGKEAELVTAGNPDKQYTEGLGPGADYKEKPAWNLNGKPLVVLIDPGTASAAEIVAGAVWPDAALVTGGRSFGKGVGQRELPLGGKRSHSLGGSLILTMFRYEFSDHFSPQLVSVLPHIEIPDPELAGARVAAQRSGTPVFEEDYGQDRVIPAGNGGARQVTARLASRIAEISRREKAGEFSNACKNSEDCPKEKGIAYLRALAGFGVQQGAIQRYTVRNFPIDRSAPKL